MWPFTPSYPEVKLHELSDQYDYIVVGELSIFQTRKPAYTCMIQGGGTAGCVLANRLSADMKTRVLVVERGPLADSWASRVPLFSSDFASDGSRTLKTPSVYQEILGHPLELYTGKGLGGTTRINQMLYTRGLPAEYDAWRNAGRKGWGWEDLKPFFLKSEHANYAADSSVHGKNGSCTCRSTRTGIDHGTFSTGEWHNSTNENFYFKGFDK